MLEITKKVAPAFYDYVFDWDHETYVVGGGYGSSKSYHTAFKIICKLLEERRTCLVVREVYGTIYESCYSLISEILNDMRLISLGAVTAHKSPLEFIFFNGSRIIFKGMDDPAKIKSINGVSIVWLEEAAEVKAAGFTELQGRLRTPDLSAHFILTFNPVDKGSWIYKRFFEGIINDDDLYQQKTLILGKTYYHHSTPDDNPYLPQSYIDRLDDLINYDPDLYRVARLGHFGTNGIKVLPNFSVAETSKSVYEAVSLLNPVNIKTGMDFGFEESFNAVVTCAVDHKNKILYIFREYYKNHMTDPETAADPDFKIFNRYSITADSAEPKTIKYYRDMGYRMRPAKKFQGSRLEYTKKMRRFRKIICAPCCPNVIRELSTLTYAKDKQGNTVYDQFNIDPHTLSALWYALDNVNVADVKDKKNYSKKGDTS